MPERKERPHDHGAGGPSGEPHGPLTWRKLRFLQLFVFLTVLLFLLPLQVEYHLVAWVAQALILNGILVAMSAAGGTVQRRLLIWGWTAGLLLQAISAFRPAGAFPWIAESVGTLVLLLSVWVILHYVFQTKVITVDTLFAAIVAYMFIALVFARLYRLLEAVAPYSFDLREGADSQIELLYFSFVTIATLGYGDVAPRLPFVQMLAVMEAVVGQFYVAVIIAWLVSVLASRRTGAR